MGVLFPPCEQCGSGGWPADLACHREPFQALVEDGHLIGDPLPSGPVETTYLCVECEQRQPEDYRMAAQLVDAVIALRAVPESRSYRDPGTFARMN